MQNMNTNIIAALGRNGDSLMAHVTPGDVIIPRDIVLENPEFLTKFKKAMQNMGGDYRTHIAGSGYDSINPDTGQPEYFFSGIRNFFRNPGKQLKNLVRDPIGTAIDSVVTSNPLYALPGTRGMFDAIGDTAKALVSGAPQQSAPTPEPEPAPDLGEVEEEFTPKRPQEPTKPYNLFASEAGGQPFNTLDPMQQRSYLASQGVFGGGIGNQEKDYYLQLLQRNLIDEGGQLGNINQALLPVERNYLSRLGLPTDNTQAFFQALQG